MVASVVQTSVNEDKDVLVNGLPLAPPSADGDDGATLTPRACVSLGSGIYVSPRPSTTILTLTWFVRCELLLVNPL